MTRYIRALCGPTLISLALTGGYAYAADPPKAAEIHTVTLLMSPAPEPRFALQYRFDVPYLELEPGNAAFLYQTAVGVGSGTWPIDGEVLRKWLDAPAESLPWDEVRPVVARFEYTFDLLEEATRRGQCTWEYPIPEEGVPYMNPLLNEYRTLTRFVALKATLEIHDGDFDAALDTLRCGFVLARHVGDGPNLVQHLVGVWMAASMLDQIEELIQKPGAPNLYWALTALPEPLVDIRNAVRMEAEVLSVELPELRTLEDTVLSNEQVVNLWNRATVWVGLDSSGPDRWLDKVRDLAAAIDRYPRAKAALQRHGYPAEDVEAWPALYVIVLDQYQQFRAIRDMTFKWMHVPYPEAREGLKNADLTASAIWKYSRGSILANPFVNSLPSMNRMAFLDARLARDLAMLRCVEAIRLYAAEHGGTLPESLSDITAIPVPFDPLCGQTFQYDRVGGRATLVSPVPPDATPKDGLRYEITLR